MDIPVWVIFHRGDNRWVLKRTRLVGHVGGRPLVWFEMSRPTVTSYDFIFETEQAAQAAADRYNVDI